jgi:hypothetical protein
LIAIQTPEEAVVTQALRLDRHFRDDPIPSIGETTPFHLDEGALKTPADSRHLVLAMFLISTSVFATLAWTAAVAWSAEMLIRSLIAAIDPP